MFTYTLSGKTIENGKNRITVAYSNGTVKCDETFFFNSKEELDQRITDKLADLDKVVALDASINVVGYVKTDKPVIVTEVTALDIAEAKLYEMKKRIELGVLKETEQEFIDAVAEYKLAISTK